MSTPKPADASPSKKQKPAPAQSPAEGDREALPDDVKPSDRDAPGG